MLSPDLTWHPWTLSLPEGQLTGKCRGRGDRVLLCLPGYRQGTDAFDALLPPLPGWCCVVMVPPPGGQSCWRGPAWTPATLATLWTALMAQFPGASWSLLGFSMGGKLAMCLAAAAPVGLVAQVFLLAPDGIRSHPLQAWASRAPAGRALLAWVMRHPVWLQRLAQLAHRSGLLPSFLAGFVAREFSTQRHRAYLAETLRLYGHLSPPGPAVPSVLIWGRHDPLLPRRALRRWLRRHPLARLHLLPGGHLLLPGQAVAIGQILGPYWAAPTR